MLTRLLGVFTGNPVVMLYVALAIALFAGAGGAYGAWTLQGWRLGEKVEHAERERDVATGQSNVNAAAVESCNASITAHKTNSDSALAEGKRLLNAANIRAQHAEDQLTALDVWLRNPPPNAGCDSAWEIIERAAEVKP